VKRAYNNALVLIRFLGLYFLITGFMGLAYIIATVAFHLSALAPWLMEPPLYFAAQGVIGNPIYLAAGVIVLLKSESLARFITKHCENEGAA
jgi:hypothetical protein